MNAMMLSRVSSERFPKRPLNSSTSAIVERAPHLALNVGPTRAGIFPYFLTISCEPSGNELTAGSSPGSPTRPPNVAAWQDEQSPNLFVRSSALPASACAAVKAAGGDDCPN